MNRFQEIQLELIELASFNQFNGKKIVSDLKAQPELWSGIIFREEGLIALRDIAEGTWHADHLYILAQPDKEFALENLTEQWNADIVEWFGGDAACDMLGDSNEELKKRLRAILHLWWD